MKITVKDRWLVVWLGAMGLMLASRVWADPPTATSEGTTSTVKADLAKSSDGWRHMKIAADHLRSAGRKDLAEALLVEAEKIRMQQALKEKLAQLASLRLEVAKLRTDLGLGQTVVLKMMVVECELGDELRNGLEVFRRIDERCGVSVPTEAKGTFRCVDSVNVAKDLLEELKDVGVAKLLSEPTLVTLSGRAASLHTGGLHPIVVPKKEGRSAVEFCEIGTRVEAMPTVHPDGTLRLDLRMTYRGIEGSEESDTDDAELPKVHARSIDTAIEMEIGQTAILLVDSAQPNQQIDMADRDGKIVFLTVTPQFGEASSLQQAKKPETQTR